MTEKNYNAKNQACLMEIRVYNKPDMEELKALYQSVGWTNYTEHMEMLENAYEHSLKIYGAYVNEKLAGIIRVVGDGCSVIYIQDILVFPEYQRQGIGKSLINKILTEYADVYQIMLTTDDQPKTKAFYKSAGFIAHSEIGCEGFGRYAI